jgi:predicted nuclease of predicted toxin-antitoxin system
MMSKILADENVHSEIVDRLMKHGHDVVTAVQAGLAGRDDRHVLDWAESRNRVLLTGDKDFGGLLEFGPLYQQGKVILLRYEIINVQRIADEVNEILRSEKSAIDGVQPLMIVASEGRWRIHRPGSDQPEQPK